MSAPRSSTPLRLLRSRRLAVWLLGGVALWSAVGTTALEWAYSSPVFLAAVGLLAISTTVCAWERTRVSWGEWRRTGMVTEASVRRLRDRPHVSIAAPGGAEALASAADGLRAAGLRVRQGPRLSEGVAGRWGLFGSPVFHWALALLILAVALGQLTRSEGFIGIPEGESRPEVAASYGVLEAGPLRFGHTGLEVAVTDLQLGFVEGGVDRGAAPIVMLSRDGRPVAEQRVYPNHPLRFERLLIHMDDYGFAPVVVVQDGNGTEVARETFLVDFDEAMPGGLTGVEFGIADASGTLERYTGRLTLSLPEEGSTEGSAEIQVFDAAGSVIAREVARGEELLLPTGERIVLESIGRYARLSIADDWSVPLIYALLGLASLGITLAVFSPYRKAWVLLVEDEDGTRLHVRAKHWRGSPTFADDVTEAVRAAVTGGVEVPDDD